MLNGINVPVSVQGATFTPERLQDSERAENMALIEDLRATKLSLKLRLKIQRRANAFAFRQLVHGEGHYWSFDNTAGGGGTAGLYSSRGLPPTGAITGVTLGTAAPAPWLGAGRVAITTGNSLVYTLGAGLPGITVMAAMNVNSGGWNHIIKDDGGTVFTNGALAGAAATIAITLATGVVALSTAGGVTYQYDELVILPFRLPSDWPAQAYAFQNPAGGATQWGSLRQTKLSGEVLPEGGTKIVHGRIASEEIEPATVDGIYDQGCRNLVAEFAEV